MYFNICAWLEKNKLPGPACSLWQQYLFCCKQQSVLGFLASDECCSLQCLLLQVIWTCLYILLTLYSTLSLYHLMTHCENIHTVIWPVFSYLLMVIKRFKIVRMCLSCFILDVMKQILCINVSGTILNVSLLFF